MNAPNAMRLYLLGSILVWMGERFFGEGHDLRPIASWLGFALVVLATLLRTRKWLNSAGESRRVLSRLVPTYATGLAALVVYGLSLPSSPLKPDADLQVVLSVVWPILWVIATLPILSMERALHGMKGAPGLEVPRLLDSGAAGLSVALAACWLVAFNFVANHHNERIDLRTIKNLDPSPATLEMARNLDAPVEVTLFFPPANDVLEQIQPYFDQLDAASDQLTLRRIDRDMRPRLAKELRARKNGTVVLSRGETHESLALDVDPDKARRKLKKLDTDLQKKLNKIARDERVAYVVTGHGERSTSPRGEDRPGLKDLQEVLKVLNYKVKKLGINEGLSADVPEDATIVLLVGPDGPMMDAEQQALIRYVERGGALLAAIDPEHEEPLRLEPLLQRLGLRVADAPLANATKHVQFDRSLSDRAFLFSNRFTSHDSTAVLSKLGSRVVVMFPTTGSLDKAEAAGDADVTFTLRSLSGTWADLNGDMEFDKGSENKQVWNLVAAVELPSPGGDAKGGRAVVTADADLISDTVLRNNPGNGQWLADAVRWLEDDVELGAEVAQVEDVAIIHTRAEDKAWFYGTVLGMPLLILGLGGLVQRRRGRTA